MSISPAAMTVPTVPAGSVAVNPRDFWSRLTPVLQDQLSSNRGGRSISFPRGRGTLPPTEVAIVMDGRMRTHPADGAFREHAEGEVINLSALQGSPREEYFTYWGAELLLIPADGFDDFLRASRLYPVLMAAQQSRITEADHLRALTGTAVQRMAGFLVEMSRPEHRPRYLPARSPQVLPGDRELTILEQNITQQDIAAWAGMSLRSVQRAMAVLHAEGLIGSSYWGGTLIPDLDRLRNRAVGIETPPLAKKS